MKFSFPYWFSKILYHHPKKLFCFGILLVAMMLPGVFKLTKDYSYRQLSSPDNPKLVNYDLYEKKFGNDDSASIIVHNPGGIFQKETIIALKNLQSDLSLIPNVMRIESLLDGNVVKATEDSIEIKGLIQKEQIENLNQTKLTELKNQALSSPQIASYLVSSDATLTFIHLFINPSKLLGQTDLYDLSVDAENVLERHKANFPGSEIMLSGSAFLSKTMIDVSRNDQRRLGPLILLVFALIAFITFRNIRGVLLLLVIISINVLCTMGIQGYLAFPVNAFTASIGIIVTTITTGGVIHVMSGFYSNYRLTGDTAGALIHTYRENMIPTFLTSFTTCVGFLALSDKNLLPIYQLGIVLGTGSMIAWTLIFTILGPMIWAIHRQQNPSRIGSDGLPQYEIAATKEAQSFSKKYVQFIQKYKNTIIFLWLLALSLSLYVLPTLEIRMNPFAQFSENLPIIRTKNLIKEKMGFAMFNELLIDTGEADGGKKVDTLKRLAAFEDEILRDPNITKNVSMTSIIKDLNQTFNGGKKEEYRIPDSNEAIAQYLLLYSFSDNGKLKNFMSEDGRYLKSTLYTGLEDSNKILAQMDNIEEVAKRHGLNLKVTGKLPLFMELGLVIFQVIGKSSLFSIVAIALIMFLLVRNVKLGILSMIPNVIPVMLGGGIIKLLGFGIDISTTLIFSVCLGIAVDDTIHFIHHWLHHKKEGKTSEESLELIVENLFPMIIATTVILSFGFGVMALADFLPNVKFGILTAIILSLAMFADLLLLPSILLKKNLRH